MTLLHVCQLPQSDRRAMVHEDIVVACCDDRTIQVFPTTFT
jgi:hypothetical protein